MNLLKRTEPTVIEMIIKHESRFRKATKIITQFNRWIKCNINGSDMVENELKFIHEISWELHERHYRQLGWCVNNWKTIWAMLQAANKPEFTMHLMTSFELWILIQTLYGLYYLNYINYLFYTFVYEAYTVVFWRILVPNKSHLTSSCQ